MKGEIKMGIAALVLGIVSIILSFIPFCGIIAVVPAIIGLILGIVEVVKKSKAGENKGMGIAGIILTALAIVITIVYNVFVVALIGAAATDYDSYDYNSIYDSYYDYN